MRFAAAVEYNGAAMRGFQRQRNTPNTVQQALESALSRVANEPVRLTCAGRTDAGVHATCQIVHFDAGATRSTRAWQRGVNSLTPTTVNLLWVSPVADEFHARFSASARRYQYLLADRPVAPALLRNQVGWHERWVTATALDTGAMQTAARALLGEQDFSAFRAAGCQSSTPMRHLMTCRVDRLANGLILIDLVANAFLLHMVRNIVGSLAEIGTGRRDPDWLAALLAGRDRRAAAPTAPPQGLYLAGVYYGRASTLPRTYAAAPLAGLSDEPDGRAQWPDAASRPRGHERAGT